MKNMMTGRIKMLAKTLVWMLKHEGRFIVLAAVILCACERRPLEDEFHETALIPVKIDWSRSGINAANERTTDEVHRVSIRFFPKDGSPVFDRYLDTDVTEGNIRVPLGGYSVIVFNESVHDEEYWGERIRFADVNSYTDFSAAILPHGDDVRKHQFPYYRPLDGERFILEPLALASWSLDDFEVTRQMVAQSSRVLWDETRAPGDYHALTQVVMRGLTHKVNVEARVTNLVSTYYNHCAKRGFASKVYMASARTANPVSYMFALNGRRYDEDKKSGTTRSSFLSFGRVTTPGSRAAQESYMIAADVYLVNDELHTADAPLLFDVTDQVMAAGNGPEINIRIGYDLPHVQGGIAVDEWDENEYDLE